MSGIFSDLANQAKEFKRQVTKAQQAQQRYAENAVNKKKAEKRLQDEKALYKRTGLTPEQLAEIKRRED